MILAEADIPLKDWRFRVYPIGDMHLTLRTFNEKRLRKYIKTIADDPAGIAILMGDVSDARSKEHKYFNAEMIHPRYKLQDIDKLEELAAQEAAELLSPLKQKLIGTLRGNHHQKAFTHSLRWRYRALTGHDPADLGDRAMLRLRAIGNRRNSEGTYVVFAQHRASVGQSPGSRKNAQVKLVQSFDADLYVFAHAHAADEHRQPYWRMRRSGRLALEARPKVLLFANAWLEHMAIGANDYADEKGLLPQDDTVWFADVHVETKGATMTTKRRIWDG